MKEDGEYSISVEKLLKIVHIYSERIKIRIVNPGRNCNHFLTEDLSGSDEEMERIRKYYGDVPVWNIHVELSPVCVPSRHGSFVVGTIVANCYYDDARVGLILEKEDKRKARARERYARKKESAENAKVD